MHTFKFSLLSTALLSTATIASPVVIFGDSLSDMGQQGWHHAATYQKPDGYLHLLYGQHLDPNLKASSLGGLNFAYSGGVLVKENGSDPKQENLWVQKQINNYLDQGIHQDARHILWAGGNDVASIAQKAMPMMLMGKNTQEILQFAEMESKKIVQAVEQGVQQLKTAGVEQIILPEIPDVSQTPLFQNLMKTLPKAKGDQLQTMATTLVENLNQSISQALTSHGNVVRMNTTALMNDIFAHPEHYGLTDVKTPAAHHSLSDPTNQGKPTTQNPDEHLFADSFHPGPIAHQAFADYVNNVLAVPESLSLVNDIFHQQSQKSLMSLRHLQPQKEAGLTLSMNQEVEAHRSSTHLTIAYQFTPNWQWAMHFSRGASDNSSLGTNIKGDYLQGETLLRFDKENYFAGVYAGINYGKFKLNRTNFIGLSQHLQTGERHGEEFNAGLFAGIKQQWHETSLQFSTDLTQYWASLDPLPLEGSELMKMFIQRENHQTLEWGIDAKLAYQWQTFEPYLSTRLSKSWQSGDKARYTFYNGNVFDTKINHKNPIHWAIQAGVNYQSPNLPLAFSFDIRQDLKNDLDKNTRYQLGVTYQF